MLTVLEINDFKLLKSCRCFFGTFLAFKVNAISEWGLP